MEGGEQQVEGQSGPVHASVRIGAGGQTGTATTAIGEKARRPRRQQPPLRIVRFSGAALSEGVEHHTDFGVPVRVYSVAKTVADLFKYRRKLGYPGAVRALRDALLAGLCTPEEILRFGAICHVTRTLEPYLEVLMTRRGADIQKALANRRALAAPRLGFSRSMAQPRIGVGHPPDWEPP
jgi:hypothetical protein